jgi:hypothetical protein
MKLIWLELSIATQLGHTLEARAANQRRAGAQETFKGARTFTGANRVASILLALFEYVQTQQNTKPNEQI